MSSAALPKSHLLWVELFLWPVMLLFQLLYWLWHQGSATQAGEMFAVTCKVLMAEVNAYDGRGQTIGETNTLCLDVSHLSCIMPLVMHHASEHVVLW